MTDEQIIKALDMCSNWENDKTCEECPANVFDFSCANKTSKFALSLINRQKAEIERLKKRNTLLLKKKCKDINTARKIIKSEAIKEFAERLKEEMRLDDDCKYDCAQCHYDCKDYIPFIDNLVKEMTEVER